MRVRKKSCCMQEFESRFTDLQWIWYWEVLLKYVHTSHISLNSDKSNGNSTLRPKCVSSRTFIRMKNVPKKCRIGTRNTFYVHCTFITCLPVFQTVKWSDTVKLFILCVNFETCYSPTKIQVLCDFTPCRLVNSYRCFKTAYYHHLQGQAVQEAFLISLPVDTE